MSILKICEKCGTGFSIPNRRSDQVKFCSRACKTASGWVALVCARCGAAFKRKKSDTSRSRYKTFYCSTRCTAASRLGSKYAVDPNAPRYYRTCEVCAVQFQVTMTRKDTARFCSRACQSNSPEFRKEMSESQIGVKHWRWSGGEYKGKSGYVRTKTKRLGLEDARFSHRFVVEKAMLASVPEHPFLIIVDGNKKLNPEIEVHHIDRDRANNKLSNLLAVTKYAHSQIHHRNRKPELWECWPPNPSRWLTARKPKRRKPKK